jgi:antitoxin VapB
MRRAAKVFMNNRSQAVRLQKEFQFTTREVFIRKEGGDVILSPRPTDWSSYLDEAPQTSS